MVPKKVKDLNCIGFVSFDWLYRQKIMALTRYMNKKKIDKETQARIRKYLEYITEARRTHDGYDEEINRILQKLSTNLQSELMTQVKGKILKDNSLFRYRFSSKFLALLSTHLLEKTLSPEEILFKVLLLQLLFLIFQKLSIHLGRRRG